jgi:hypothetical protein
MVAMDLKMGPKVPHNTGGVMTMARVLGKLLEDRLQMERVRVGSLRWAVMIRIGDEEMTAKEHEMTAKEQEMVVRKPMIAANEEEMVTKGAHMVEKELQMVAMELQMVAMELRMAAKELEVPETILMARAMARVLAKSLKHLWR